MKNKLPLSIFHKVLIAANQPFATYKEPNGNIFTIYCNGSSSNYTEIESAKIADNKGFVFAPFNDKLPILLINSKNIVKGKSITKSIVETIEINLNYSSINFPKSRSKLKSEYIQSVECAKNKIAEGEVDKIVISRIKSFYFKNLLHHAPALYDKIIHQYSLAYCYMCYFPNHGLWLGATPELFLQVDDCKVETAAVAGTRSIKNKLNEWVEKDIEEQEFVVQHCYNQLIKSNCTEINISKKYTYQAGNIEHLKNDFTANINCKNINTLINNLHPTPAVCGAPVSVSHTFVKNIEKYDRAYYSGFLGRIKNKKSMKLYVNIRSMRLSPNKADIFVGAGVTKNSIPELEWKETLLKSKTMLSILKIIEKSNTVKK